MREDFVVNEHSFIVLPLIHKQATLSENNDPILDTLSFSPRGATAYSRSFLPSTLCSWAAPIAPPQLIQFI